MRPRVIWGGVELNPYTFALAATISMAAAIGQFHGAGWGYIYLTVVLIIGAAVSFVWDRSDREQDQDD